MQYLRNSSPGDHEDSSVFEKSWIPRCNIRRKPSAVSASTCVLAGGLIKEQSAAREQMRIAAETVKQTTLSPRAHWFVEVFVPWRVHVFTRDNSYHQQEPDRSGSCGLSGVMEVLNSIQQILNCISIRNSSFKLTPYWKNTNNIPMLNTSGINLISV